MIAQMKLKHINRNYHITHLSHVDHQGISLVEIGFRYIHNKGEQKWHIQRYRFILVEGECQYFHKWNMRTSPRAIFHTGRVKRLMDKYSKVNIKNLVQEQPGLRLNEIHIIVRNTPCLNII